MAYFRLIQQQQQAGLYDPAAHDRFMTTVARPDAETGAPNFLQGADPYQVRGGIDWARFKSDEAYNKQVIKNIQDQLAFQKGQSIGYVDGKRTLEGVMRDDDIRRNPMNAAIYEQERRGYRPDAGNMNAEQYMYGNVGDEKSAPKATAPKTPTTTTKPTSQTSSTTTKPTSQTSSTSTRRTSTAPQRVAGNILEARINPNTGQAEFRSEEGWFSVDKGTTSRLGAGDYGQNTRGTGDDTLVTGSRTYNNQQAASALRDYNKRVASLTPEAAKAFAAYDAARAVPGNKHGGEVAVPGYDGASDLRALAEAYNAYATQMAPKLGAPEGAAITPNSDTDKILRKKWTEALTRINTLQKDIDAVQRLKKSGGDIYSKENRERLGRIQQLLDINWKKDSMIPGVKKDAKDSDLFNSEVLDDSPNNIRYRYTAPTDFFQKEVERMQPYGSGLRDTINAYTPYVQWLQQLYDPQVNELAMPKFKTGGQMTIGGAPHWVVDPMGRVVAALTEDGKPETIKGKGGVEVIPTDPARKRNYLKNRIANRPGAASGDRTKTLSGKTTKGETKARTKGATDGRVNNGKTNNGRVSPPGEEHMPGVTDKDAASVRKPVAPMMQGSMGAEMMSPKSNGVGMGMGMGKTMNRGKAMGKMGMMNPGINGGGMGMPTIPVQEPSGAVMPYRSVAPGQIMPMYVPGNFAGGIVPTRSEYYTYTDAQGRRKRGHRTRSGLQNIGKVIMKPQQTQQTQQTPMATIQPIGPSQRLTNPDGSLATPNIPAMDASGGTRIVGNATAPTARYGFDRGAPIDIAANAFTRGVKGSPGVFVDQPWKHAPRALLQRGTFGNQLLQSYWNATGAAPEDLAERGRVAVPGDATSGRSFF